MDGRTGFADAYREAITAVIARGAVVDVGVSRSTAAGRSTREILNYGFDLSDARDRVAISQSRPFNVFAAVGRWVWMVSASNLLRDIEFYDPRARAFSDDGLVVPGSSDGARLIAGVQGINQLERVIELLGREANTRRAAVTIYGPQDVGRESVDIPCALGLVFNLRDDVLHTTVIMRANNALTVLPHDVFQFSMLAELVAAELDVELGPYHHYAASLHIYGDHLAAAREVASERPTPAPAMRPMPRSAALASSRRLVDVEARIRGVAQHGSPLELTTLDELIGRELDPYWGELARVLLVWAIEQSDLAVDVRGEAVDGLLSRIGEPLAGLARRRLGRAAPVLA